MQSGSIGIYIKKGEKVIFFCHPKGAKRGGSEIKKSIFFTSSLFLVVSDPESVYVSRKLLIRQMQKQIAKVSQSGDPKKHKFLAELSIW